MVVACRIRRAFQYPTPTVAVVARCLRCLGDETRTSGVRNGMADHSRNMSSEIKRIFVPPVKDKGQETEAGPHGYSRRGDEGQETEAGPHGYSRRGDEPGAKLDSRGKVEASGWLSRGPGVDEEFPKFEVEDYLSHLELVGIASKEVSENQPSQHLVMLAQPLKHVMKYVMAVVSRFSLEPHLLRQLTPRDPQAGVLAHVIEMSFADSTASTRAKDLLSKEIQVFFYAKRNEEDDEPYRVPYTTQTIQMEILPEELRETLRRMRLLSNPPFAVWTRTAKTTESATDGTKHFELTFAFDSAKKAATCRWHFGDREPSIHYVIEPSVHSQVCAQRDEILKGARSDKSLNNLVVWGFEDNLTAFQDLKEEFGEGVRVALHVPDNAVVFVRFVDSHMTVAGKKYMEQLGLQAQFLEDGVILKKKSPYEVLFRQASGSAGTVKRSSLRHSPNLKKTSAEGSKARAHSDASNAVVSPTRTLRLYPWNSSLGWDDTMHALDSAGFRDSVVIAAGYQGNVLHLDTAKSAEAVLQYLRSRGISANFVLPQRYEDPQRRQQAVTSFVHRKIVKSYPFEPEPEARVDVSIEQLRWGTADPKLDLSLAELENEAKADLDMEAMMHISRTEYLPPNVEDADAPYEEKIGAEPDEFQPANGADSVSLADHEAEHTLQASSPR